MYAKLIAYAALFVYLVVGFIIWINEESNRNQAVLNEHLSEVQQQLMLSDWERDNTEFRDDTYEAGYLIRRIQGCRLIFDFVTNSTGEFAFVVGSGRLSDARISIKPYEKADGTVFIHTEDECEHIGQTWVPPETT